MNMSDTNEISDGYHTLLLGAIRKAGYRPNQNDILWIGQGLTDGMKH
jgi:hypothetical protein